MNNKRIHNMEAYEMGLTSEQMSKIRADLGATQQNMDVFSEMLTELRPGQEHPEDRSLLAQLHTTCLAMQTRLVQLIDQVDDDKLTADLLEANDNMNNLFLRFDRYEKNKVQQATGAIKKTTHGGAAAVGAAVAGAAAAGAPARQTSDTPLIDFSSGEAEPPPSLTGMIPSLQTCKDDDMAHVAEWIGDKEEGVTTSEFDKFLAERAAAAAESAPKKAD